MNLLLLFACTAGTGLPDSGGVDSGRQDAQAQTPPPLGVGTRWRLDAAELGLDTSRAVGFGGPGVAVADLDLDGDHDLAWVSPRGWGLVLDNDGAGAFTVIGELPGATGISAADPDGDGDLDLLLLAEGEDLLLLNDGSGRFQSIPLTPGDPRTSHSASWSDLDADGDLDLFVARYKADLNGAVILDEGGEGDGNQVFLGDGSGGLLPDDAALDQAARVGLSFHGAWVDVDGDVDLDLYIVNDFGPTATPNRLLRNDGGQLVDATDDCACGLALFGMGVGVGDPDGDGDADLFVTNLGPPRFLANDGAGVFVDAGVATGLQVPDDAVHDASWGAAFVDVDLDGWEDLAVTFGQLDAPGTLMAEWLAEHEEVVFENAAEQPDVLLHNLVDDGWADEAASSGFGSTDPTKAVATGDLDGDGQPELVTVGLDFLEVFDPAPTDNHALVINLDAGASNRFGLGARVDAVVDGQLRTRWMQPTSQGSFASSAPEIIIGLGAADQVDQLRVTWPDGLQQDLGSAPAGRLQLRR